MRSRRRLALVLAAIAVIGVAAIVERVRTQRSATERIEHQLDKRTGNARFACRRFGVLAHSHPGANTADLPDRLAAGTTVFDCRVRGMPVGAVECTGLTTSGEPVVIRAETKSGAVQEGRACGAYRSL